MSGIGVDYLKQNCKNQNFFMELSEYVNRLYITYMLLSGRGIKKLEKLLRIEC